MPKTKPKIARQIVDGCNALARLFYASNGYQVEKGFRFDLSCHPQERGMWTQACIAYQHIEGTDPEDALSELDEE